jgi:hypothetical protein
VNDGTGSVDVPRSARPMRRGPPFGLLRNAKCFPSGVIHMYLLSENGRVYRAYDDLRTPDGDIHRFDFDRAEIADPVNSGRYTIEGGQIVMRMGERHEETIVVPMPRGGRLTIETVEYHKQ